MSKQDWDSCQVAHLFCSEAEPLDVASHVSGSGVVLFRILNSSAGLQIQRSEIASNLSLRLNCFTNGGDVPFIFQTLANLIQAGRACIDLQGLAIDGLAVLFFKLPMHPCSHERCGRSLQFLIGAALLSALLSWTWQRKVFCALFKNECHVVWCITKT